MIVDFMFASFAVKEDANEKNWRLGVQAFKHGSHAFWAPARDFSKIYRLLPGQEGSIKVLQDAITGKVHGIAHFENEGVAKKALGEMKKACESATNKALQKEIVSLR